MLKILPFTYALGDDQNPQNGLAAALVYCLGRLDMEKVGKTELGKAYDALNAFNDATKPAIETVRPIKMVCAHCGSDAA